MNMLSLRFSVGYPVAKSLNNSRKRETGAQKKKYQMRSTYLRLAVRRLMKELLRGKNKTPGGSRVRKRHYLKKLSSVQGGGGIFRIILGSGMPRIF